MRVRRRVFPKKAGQGALWVWRSPGEVGPEALISVARAVGAGALYLNFYPLSGAALDWLESVMVAADKAGFRIELLCGSPGWIKGSSQPFLVASIIEPLLLLRDRLKARGIDQPLPLHLDVEPHIEAPLDEDRLTGYLGFLEWLRARLGPSEIAVDVPIWYSKLSLGGRPFSEALLPLVDSVTLMAYGQSLKSVVSGCLPWLEAASRTGQSVSVGLEVGNQGPVRLETPRQISSAARAVAHGLKRRPGFSALRGIGVHHFDPFGF